jgi:bacteriocin biosynthesis cyclodehydratase domain-containing protein
MVLKLADGVPLVWRTPSSVQLGVARPLVVLDDVTAAHERLLAALAKGVSESGFAMMARDAGADPRALLGRVAPALAPPGRGPSAPRIAVLGAGPLAEELARQVGHAADPELVVLVAAWVVAPADHGAWLRRDVRHLPVVVGENIDVGPLVVPGETACLHCLDLARRDDDAAWPAIAAQLHGRPAPALSRTAIAEAAAFAARHLEAEPGTSWRIDPADGGVSARVWARHPECSCAAPPGSDWAPAAARAALPAPS